MRVTAELGEQHVVNVGKGRGIELADDRRGGADVDPAATTRQVRQREPRCVPINPFLIAPLLQVGNPGVSQSVLPRWCMTWYALTYPKYYLDL